MQGLDFSGLGQGLEVQGLYNLPFYQRSTFFGPWARVF